jgi:hypothetical protein
MAGEWDLTGRIQHAQSIIAASMKLHMLDILKLEGKTDEEHNRRD